jgi:hypothetical protein
MHLHMNHTLCKCVLSEQTCYNEFGYYIRRDEPDWLSACDMFDVQPAKEEGSSAAEVERVDECMYKL